MDDYDDLTIDELMKLATRKMRDEEDDCETIYLY